jgi:two-component system cell cycle response regulator DivK
MDIALPKVNGIEAFHEIRGTKELEHIPIIAITASALEEEKERILSHGFDAFIPKPIIAETFLQTVESVMYDE